MMKVADGLKVIEKGWMPKPKGFRVKFHQQTANGVEVGLSPPAGAAPLNSDVTAWRYAWKLWQATQRLADAGAPGALYNITVVDDDGQPIRFYGTGALETYRRRKIDDDPSEPTANHGP